MDKPLLNGNGASEAHEPTNGPSIASEPSKEPALDKEPEPTVPAPAPIVQEKEASAPVAEATPTATPSDKEDAAQPPKDVPEPVAPQASEEPVQEPAPAVTPVAEPAGHPAGEPAASDSVASEKSPAQEPRQMETPAVPVESVESPHISAPSKDIPMEEAEEPKPVEPAESKSEIFSGSVSEATPAETPKEAVVEAKVAESDIKMEDAAPSAPSPDTKSPTNDALPASEVDLQPASMSQLNIETQPDSSQVFESVELSMTEAPSNKIAREREDDEAVEPAPKRARTEPEEDTPKVETPAAQQAASTPAVEQQPKTEDQGTPAAADAPAGSEEAAPSLDDIPRWNDSEANAKTFSPYQRREIRKTIGRMKKTKGGSNFRDAVVKLWPALRDGYLARIDKPMDLAELDRNLRDGSSPYNTFGQFKDELSLIFRNALVFNGATHGVTSAAFVVVKTVWEELLAIPEEEPVKPKAAPKPKPVRESRAVANAEAAARRQSAGPVASPAREPSETKAPAVQDQGGDRRGSTDGDRPKRTVRAPKPKDIDYTKPSRKKLKPELQFCAEVLNEIMHPKHERLNMWFKEPVDAEGLNIPDYYSIIKKPMDLGKVSRMLAAGEFTNLKDFDKHVRLVFENCYTFNGPVSQGNPVSMTAKELENVYVAEMKHKDAWLAKFAKANAPTSASNASDDDEDEDEDAEDGATAEDNSKEIQELNAKLMEETKKLHAMFVPGANQSMIDIQKGIVDMVQQALMKAVASAGETQPKPERGTKKGRGGKKAGGAGRKSSGAAQPKKASGPKKGAAKKTLTAADKDSIANAINDLENAHLDRAIDIIKKDTGQNVRGNLSRRILRTKANHY